MVHVNEFEIMYDRSKLKINAYKSKGLVVVRRNQRVVSERKGKGRGGYI